MEGRQAKNVADAAPAMPGQVVLVMQGGGALGAYQGGVFHALHEAGIAPDWVIGTSIGAINGAIIAGNSPAQRLERLREFWLRVERKHIWSAWPFGATFDAMTGGLATLWSGLPGFFSPNFAASWGLRTQVGVERAAFYSAESLRATLGELIDADLINSGKPRLTVGAVNVRSGKMHYFDSRDTKLGLDHVMASGALPPALPAVRIGDDPYWDGGIYSNTPIEAVFADKPRRDSVIFAVQVWHAEGPEPDSLWQVFNRQKDIQYGSRVDSHIAQQKQLHQMRHIVRELVKLLPEHERTSAKVRNMADYGCGTTMHVVRLAAPRLAGEDHMRDIDFSAAGIQARWRAGYADTQSIVRNRPWTAFVDPMVGVAVHDHEREAM